MRGRICAGPRTTRSMRALIAALCRRYRAAEDRARSSIGELAGISDLLDQIEEDIARFKTRLEHIR